MITNERAKALSFLGLNKPTLESDSNGFVCTKSESKGFNGLKVNPIKSQTYIFQVKLGHNAPPV